MLELINVAGGYGSGDIIRDVSLSFPPGQISVLIGPNGSGKSTLLKLGAGQLKPTGGDVLIEGTSLRALTPRRLAQRISYLPQSRPVPDMTVETLVLHGRFPWLSYPRVYREEDMTAATAAMKEVGIYEKRRDLLARLSGGERQKAYLAMALAQNTAHIILDEPNSNLDIAVKMELETLLIALKKAGKCVIVALHDLAAALEIADQIAVIKDGGLLAAGNPKAILETGAIEEAFRVRVTRGEQIRFEKTFA